MQEGSEISEDLALEEFCLSMDTEEEDPLEGCGLREGSPFSFSLQDGGYGPFA